MDHIFSLLNHYGIWLGFLFVAIENIGVPFPIEFVYLYAQNLIDIGRSNVLIMIFLFTLSHVSGSIIAYYLGFIGNKTVSRYFSNRPSLIKARERIERWYLKYGSATNFITRLVGYVRPWSSLIAGFGKENFWKFLGWTTLGTIIFNFIALYFAKTILFFWNSYPLAKYFIAFGFVFFFAGVWFLLPWINKKIKF